MEVSKGKSIIIGATNYRLLELKTHKKGFSSLALVRNFTKTKYREQWLKAGL